jgi:LuxR family maltose regulon positive regulatory protein
MTLHQRAADWYEASGSSAHAMEHLLDTTDWDRSVRLAAALAVPTYMAGQMATVQRWYRAVGDANIERYPPLAVLRCWEAVLTGDTAGAQRWAAFVDAAAFEGVPLDGSASFDSTRAIMRAAMCATGPEQMMADAAFALAQEPAWSSWRPEALWLLGEAHLIAGHPDEARAVLAEASAAAALPADPPDRERDRRAAVRLQPHGQGRSQVDLPQARRLLARRRGAEGDYDRPPRYLARLCVGVLALPVALLAAADGAEDDPDAKAEDEQVGDHLAGDHQ